MWTRIASTTLLSLGWLMLGGCATRLDATPSRASTQPTAAPTAAALVDAPVVPAASSAPGAGPAWTGGTATPDTPANVASGFDRSAYRADPAAYCRVVDGSRCNQVAQPGPTTPALQGVGAGSLGVRTGAMVSLRARTEPGMPVSFTSQGLGEFPASGQSAVTVAADAQGEAVAEFRASPGTVGHCLIIAGSPVRAGTVEFLVSIQE